MRGIANQQCLAFSKPCQLSQAILQLHVEWMLYGWTPIVRFELLRNEHKLCEHFCGWGGGGDDLQRALVIQTRTTSLASDSALTIAQFCPSKSLTHTQRSVPQLLRAISIATSHWSWTMDVRLDFQTASYFRDESKDMMGSQMTYPWTS